MMPTLSTLWKDKIKEDLEEFPWMNKEKVKIPEVTPNYPAMAIWKEMTKYAESMRDSELFRDMAKIKIIIEDNEKRRANQDFRDEIDNLAFKIETLMERTVEHNQNLEQIGTACIHGHVGKVQAKGPKSGIVPTTTRYSV